MATKGNSIEWIEALDKEEYIGYSEGQKYFIIKLVGFMYRCKSLPVIPVRRNFTDWDKSLSKIKKRAQEEFDSEISKEISVERVNSFQTKQRMRWQIFKN
jgi:hypothetical protein